MRTFMSVIFNLISKVFILAAMFAVFMLHMISVLATVTVRFIALPLMIVAGVLGFSTYADYGMTREVVALLLVFIGAGTFYFALPYIPGLLLHTQDVLIDALHTPVIHRSPVKYTI